MIESDFDLLPWNYYNVISADPPWEYRSKKTGGSMQSGACQKYPTMTLEELCDLPVKTIAAKNAVLFLWITTPLKVEIIESGLLKKWGFKNKTSLYWIKEGRLGLGYWWRGSVEEVLFCTRGKIPSFREPLPNVITSKVGRHSEKPAEYWNKIEPVLSRVNLNNRIELFSRKPRPGWDAFGNECCFKERIA
jgi:site-specific DNA-methyltransferase (adenine-specific)